MDALLRFLDTGKLPLLDEPFIASKPSSSSTSVHTRKLVPTGSRDSGRKISQRSRVPPVSETIANPNDASSSQAITDSAEGLFFSYNIMLYTIDQFIRVGHWEPSVWGGVLFYLL